MKTFFILMILQKGLSMGEDCHINIILCWQSHIKDTQLEVEWKKERESIKTSPCSFHSFDFYKTVFLSQWTAELTLEPGHALLKSRFHQLQLCQLNTVYNKEGLYLFWSIFLYECFKNGLGFWQKFMCTFAFLVILTGYPEFDVLLTELSFQKLCEGIQPS